MSFVRFPSSFGSDPESEFKPTLLCIFAILHKIEIEEEEENET